MPNPDLSHTLAWERELDRIEADVTTAGSGDITATVNGHAKVSMMGSGDVDLGGGANCNVTKMGSGEVTCGH